MRQVTSDLVSPTCARKNGEQCSATTSLQRPINRERLLPVFSHICTISGSTSRFIQRQRFLNLSIVKRLSPDDREVSFLNSALRELCGESRNTFCSGSNQETTPLSAAESSRISSKHSNVLLPGAAQRSSNKSDGRTSKSIGGTSEATS